MLEPMKSMPAAEYVGLDTVRSLQEHDVLQERMSDFELDYMFDATNKELKCIALGLLSSAPCTVTDPYRELMARGGGDIVDPSGDSFALLIKRMPPGLINFWGSYVSLTPMGEVAQGMAGHALQISRDFNAPLSAIFGNTKSKAVDLDKYPKAADSHLKRILTVSIVAASGQKGIPAVDLTSRLKPYDVTHGGVHDSINMLAKARLIRLEQDSKGRKLIKPVDAIEALPGAITELVEGSVARDNGFLELGRQKLRTLLSERAVLPYLVRRSLLSSGKDGHNKLKKVENQVYEILEERGGGPLSSGEILELMVDDVYSSARVLTAALGKIANNPQGARVQDAGMLRNRQKTWTIKQEDSSRGNGYNSKR